MFFSCPLSCSEELEVIASVCDSLVRYWLLLLLFVCDSLVRRCGRVAAWTDGTVPGGGGAGRGPGTTPGQE